jgi:hypothetical protein
MPSSLKLRKEREREREREKEKERVEFLSFFSKVE